MLNAEKMLGEQQTLHAVIPFQHSAFSRLDGHLSASDDNAKVIRRDFQSERNLPPPTGGNALKEFLVVFGLLALSVILLTVSFTPFGQFYLAWIALCPWLLVVHGSRSNVRALLWSWLAGTCFILAKMWWLAPVTVPGMIVLAIYCGLYWGLAAWLIRGARLLRLHALIAVPAIAAVWTAGEFARARLFTGLPWFFVGNTQTPILPMCQIADALGAWGVSFWVVCLNALAALVVIRGRSHSLVSAAASVGIFSAAVLCYGLWRMGQSVLTPGPTVSVVQTNLPQTNKGEKPVSPADMLRIHLAATGQAIGRSAKHVDLAVWSETILPPLNREARHELGEVLHAPIADDIEQSISEITEFAVANHVGILSGGRYCNQFSIGMRDGERIWETADNRNSAYLFKPDGTLGDGIGQRYDKLHLVPFGEFIPFKHSIPVLYRLFLSLGPDYYADYELQDGSDNGLTVFSIPNDAGGRPWRFVTPICFEDLDAGLCAAMFRPEADGIKRADFIVNITNDGWFWGDENALHLQSAIFRSIENRAPTARSVNTGISGFIDSCGRVSNLLPPRVEGASTGSLWLDSRLTLYTRWGDWFAWLCVMFCGGLILRCATRRYFPGA